MRSLKNLKYSDNFIKLSQKTEKIMKNTRNFILYKLGLYWLFYFIKHINPVFAPQESEKENIFYKYMRSFFSFLFSITLTGLATNFVLAVLFHALWSIETTFAYGLGWWLIQVQILGKGIDYLAKKVKEVRK